MLILGMDLGQSKTAWELFDNLTGEYQRGMVAMDDDALRKLFHKLDPELVVMEIGPLAARVHDLAQAPDRKVIVADTTQDAWKWKNVKRKTDADDAAKLVRLAMFNQLNPVHIPSPAVRAQRQLLEYRAALVADVTRIKNRIRAALRMYGVSWPKGKVGWSAKARAYLAEQARPLTECELEQLWRGQVHNALAQLAATEQQLADVTDKLDALAADNPQVQLLKQIPGVGSRTAEVLVAVLDQPRRFKSRRQVSAYAGLVPRRYQSGQMDRSGRITKRGSPLLRQVLNQAAWAAVRCNPHLREFYLRVGGTQKKRRKQAIVAVMRKLLVLGWALLREQAKYRPPPLKAPLTASAAAGLPAA